MMSNSEIKVLLIEDNPGDARLIRYMLEDARALTFTLTWVDNLSAGVDILNTQPVDVILLDLGLAQSSGIDTLHHMLALVPRVPTLIVMSGLSDENTAVEAVQSGAQDYLVKGQVDSALLVRSIRYALERSQAEEALRQAHAGLERRVAERTAELAKAVEALHAEIAERKRAEEALQERDAHIRRLVESNIIGIFFWDIDGRILDANDAFLQTIGYAKTDLLGTGVRWSDLTPPEYRGVDERAIEELRQTGTSSQFEKEFLRKDGTRVPVLIGAASLEGSEQQGIAFVLDLTARRQAEEDRQERRIAEANSRAKSAFLASVSHELRSPLNTILGFARIVARQPNLPRTAQEDMQIILRSGEHLHTLINQVLNLSKIEAGKLTLNETGFDLNRLLGELEAMFSIKATDKALRLQVARVEKDCSHIRADLVKLRQVLINLLNNALKFTEAGHVALQVTPRELPGACWLAFTITDSGPGILPIELESLFHPFNQADAGRKAQEGTGLGLVISRSYVRLMGGELRIDSKVGKGTKVSFEIPVEKIGTDTMPAPAERASQRAVALSPGQPVYRVLMADDRKDGRQLLMRLLTPLGFQLREVSNGQDALETWQAWKPHLILMDMRMPVLDGIEAARRIKSSPEGKSTIIIALTASSFEEERAEIMDAGCDDFLNKPFDESELYSMLQKHLNLSYIYQEEPAPEAELPARVEASALAAQPVWLRKALERALIELDTHAVSDLIADIRVRDTFLADALESLAQEFQYDRILHALKGRSANSDEEERT